MDDMAATTVSTPSVTFDAFLPEGESLFDYQHAGVAYALVQTADGKGTWIADEQGLGKTRQAIVTAKVRGARKILVVCKASLKGNWAKEINTCAPEWTTQILGGTRPYETVAQCCIISFDLLATWSESIIAEGYDALIVDESHYVKGLGTPKKPVQRTVAALAIADDIRSRKGLVLLLSGTPLLNRPVELVTQLMMMDRLHDVTPRPTKGDTDKDWEYSFKFTFCGPEHNGHGWEFKKSSNLDLLNTRLRGTCFVRRLRNEVLDMNETHRIHTPLSLNGGLDPYKAIENAFDPSVPGAYLKLLNELRAAVGLAKIPAAVDWVQTFMEENPGKKLVVWAWHIPVQKGITKALNAAGIKTICLKDAKDIEAAKAEFNAGDAQVIVCSLQAHREGHTLVGTGHNVTDSLFVEQPWHPGAVSQAEDRINRIGQEADVVFAHTLVVEDTVDGWLADIIATKWETFRAAADGTIPTGEEESIQNALLGLLRAKFPVQAV
jgi:SWI/SNF-related matrix-associated actin-dependent regulator of chromatin subfamily A-like protein 1